MTQLQNKPTNPSQPATLEYNSPAAPSGVLPSRRWVRALNLLGPFLGLLLVYAFFAVFAPSSFRSSGTLIDIGKQTVIVGTAALGMTAIIIAGGIDLSAGSLVALVTVTAALTLMKGHGPGAAILVAVLTGAVGGLINGSLIALLRVGPFIVTLGTLLIFRGVAKEISHQNVVVPDEGTWLETLLARPGPNAPFWMFMPPGIWVLVALAILTAAVLRYTRFGRHVFAIGSNEQTARLCGIATNRVKVLVYTLAGALIGLAGLMQFSRLTVGDPTVAIGLELDMIASVVIGGGSLSGGEGTVLGTIIGAVIMTVIKIGCAQMGLSNSIQEIVTGVIIIIAVALDRLRHRKSA